jgi:hypothetical protein
MRIDQLTRVACVSCGGAAGLVRLPKSVWPGARACPACLARYGLEALAMAADRMLADATPARVSRALPGGGRCLHCGQATLAQADGLMPAWCSSCDAERRRLLA